MHMFCVSPNLNILPKYYSLFSYLTGPKDTIWCASDHRPTLKCVQIKWLPMTCGAVYLRTLPANTTYVTKSFNSLQAQLHCKAGDIYGPCR